MATETSRKEQRDPHYLTALFKSTVAAQCAARDILVIPLVTKRRKGVRGDFIIAIERHSLSVDSVLQGTDTQSGIVFRDFVGAIEEVIFLRFFHDSYPKKAVRVLRADRGTPVVSVSVWHALYPRPQ